MKIRDGIDMALTAGKLHKGMDCYTLEMFGAQIDFIDRSGQVAEIIVWMLGAKTEVETLKDAIEMVRS